MTKTYGGKGAIRSGFTLVELLVVIAIIGILMGLLIPAVNAARETARRNQCSTQVNSLVKGAIQYEMTKKQFPGWVENFGVFVGGLDPTNGSAGGPTIVRHNKVGTWAVSLMPFLDSQATYEIWTQDKYPVCGPDHPGNPSDLANGSFLTNASPNLAIMQCPSSPSSTGQFGRNSYVSNNGFAPPMGTPSTASSPANTDYANNGTAANNPIESDDRFRASQKRANGVFVNKIPGNISNVNIVGDAVRSEDLKDGLGNTVLFSENLQARPWHQAGLLNFAALQVPIVQYPQWARFGQGFVWQLYDPNGVPSNFPGSMGPTGPEPVALRINGFNTIGNPNGVIDLFVLRMEDSNTGFWADMARPSSAHVDGVNMGFADGSSKYIQDSIDYRLYQALMTTRGKSSDVPFKEYVLKGETL